MRSSVSAIAVGPKSRHSDMHLSLFRIPNCSACCTAVFPVLAGWAMFGCGPSVQYIYEGNIRFEHCYRLDLDANIAPSHRRICWAEWVDNFSKGQTQDRLEYAKRRIAAIESGSGAALTLNLEEPSDAGPPPAALPDPTPVPINPHAPPPPVNPPPAFNSSASPAGSAVGH